jgi:transcriptional regulator with XRE-family HTH domain
MTLGQAIRQRRTAAKLRLVDLATKTGLSVSYHSQIERDQVSPSVAALGRIAEGLDTTLAELFASTEADRRSVSPVVRREKRKILIHPDSPTKNALLTPHLGGALEVMWSRIEPGGRSPVREHEGEECGVVVKGRLTCWLGSQKYVLRPGDAITFKSRVPHWYANETGAPVETIWSITPPSF